MLTSVCDVSQPGQVEKRCSTNSHGAPYCFQNELSTLGCSKSLLGILLLLHCSLTMYESMFSSHLEQNPKICGPAWSMLTHPSFLAPDPLSPNLYIHVSSILHIKSVVYGQGRNMHFPSTSTQWSLFSLFCPSSSPQRGLPGVSLSVTAAPLIYIRNSYWYLNPLICLHISLSALLDPA